MALFILFMCVFVGYGVFSIVGKSLEASKQRKIAEAEATTLVAKQTQLKAQLDELKTPEGQEAAYREQFPVVSPGERVIVINDPDSTASDRAASGVSESKGGFWRFLRSLF